MTRDIAAVLAEALAEIILVDSSIVWGSSDNPVTWYGRSATLAHAALGGGLRDALLTFGRDEDKQAFIDTALAQYRAAAEGDDGWIAWAGGECPVADETIVTAELRSGTVIAPARAHTLMWDHIKVWNDIVKYRISPAAGTAS